MNTKEKLQRAISITIESGHQLNSDAFEFLRKKALVKDPVVIINQVLKELTELELGDPLGYIADAKRLKNIYRIKILNLHVKSLLATGRTIRAFNSTTNMIIKPTR